MLKIELSIIIIMKLLLVVALTALALAGPFSHMSEQEFSDVMLMDMDENEDNFVTFGNPGDLDDLPTHFDWREEAEHCVHDIRDQGGCGSCWAFATSEVATDRYCIYTGEKVDEIKDLLPSIPRRL
jgi:C1A family cysteine protease